MKRLLGVIVGVVGVLGWAMPVSALADPKPITTVPEKSPNHTGTTIPYFSSTFTDGGVNFPYTMVGTDPQSSDQTTTVTDEIIPLRLVFADGSVSDGSSVIQDAIASPIWQSAHFTSGTTQYGDAIQRAEFWQVLAGKNYHVLLKQPTVLPTQTIIVPQSQGFLEPAGNGYARPLQLVSVAWFYAQYDQILNKLKISPETLPIAISNDVMLADFANGACCIGGYHQAASSAKGNGNRQVQTAIWADYGASPAFTNRDQIFSVDINSLSHEIAEWLNDPFGTNTVPAWYSPIAPQYGCSNVMEVGDPLVGVAFTVDGYHPQDEAYLSWFAGQSPSIAQRGQYTYLGTFTRPAPLC